jgi:uncharacterized protein (TIGR02246 family)
MRTTTVLLGALAMCGLCAAFLLTGQAQPPAGTPTAGRPADDAQQAIRRAVAAYADAFNKGDVQAIAAFWAPDAEYTSEDGEVFKGRDAIIAMFRKFLTDQKGAKMALSVKAVRVLTPEVALGEGTSEVTAPDGTVDKGRFTAAWVKSNGKWLLTSARDEPTEAELAASAIKSMRWLIGDWLSTDKDGSTAMTCKPTLGGVFLHLDFTAKRPDGTMTVMMMIGFDPLTEQVKSWTFDSLGGYGEALWSRDGHQWLGQAVGVLPDGQDGTTTYIIKYEDDHSFTLQMRDRLVAGQPLPNAEVKYVRKAKP